MPRRDRVPQGAAYEKRAETSVARGQVLHFGWRGQHVCESLDQRAARRKEKRGHWHRNAGDRAEQVGRCQGYSRLDRDSRGASGRQHEGERSTRRQEARHETEEVGSCSGNPGYGLRRVAADDRRPGSLRSHQGSVQCGRLRDRDQPGSDDDSESHVARHRAGRQAD